MKKLLAFVLAAIMAFSVLPVTALAEERVFNEKSGLVYISISDDDKYVVSDGNISGKIMAYVPVDLSKLSSVDLDKYGYGDLYYKNNDGKYEITLLLLYFYVLDNYYSGMAKELSVGGSIGSTYLKSGFWGHDENLTYYVNGKYPLASAGLGATSDSIILNDGDFIDVSMYSDWSFWSDSAAGYHYFVDSQGAVCHNFTAKAGEAAKIKYTSASTDWNASYSTTYIAAPGKTVYYAKELYADNCKSVVTDDEGFANITFPSSGTWHIWADGEYGKENTESVVSAPAYAAVEVSGEPEPAMVYGDINADGRVNLFDVIAMIKYYNGIGDGLSEEQLKAADVTGDGKVNLFDVIEMIKYYNGLIDKFSADKN